MYVLDTKEQSVIVKKLFAQNECELWYWASVRWEMNRSMILSQRPMKMNQRKHTPLYEMDTKQNQNSEMETTINS